MTKDKRRSMELGEEDYEVQSTAQQHHKYGTTIDHRHKDQHHHQEKQNPHHHHHHKDHLLVPEEEYIRSNFIMDLIEHPDEVFPKTGDSVVHLPPTTTSTNSSGGGGGVGQYVVKDALTAELHHFPSSIFQYVQKHGHHHHHHHHNHHHNHHQQHHQLHIDDEDEAAAAVVRTSVQSPRSEPPPPMTAMHSAVVSDDEGFVHKHHTPEDFLSINNDFLSTASTSGGKAFCGSATEAVVVVPAQLTEPPFPPLSSLLAEPSVAMNHSSVLHDVVNNDVIYAAAARSTIARKVLPHKKRISHKLKVAQSDADAAELALHHHSAAAVVAIIEPAKLVPASEELLRLPPLSPHVVVAAASNTLQFSCELCGHATSSQLEFFAHLKQHYEPTPMPDTILAAMKTSLDDLGPEKESLCSMRKKPDESNHDVVHQVFDDVHLNFADFQNDDEVVESVRDDVMNHHHQQHHHHHQNHHHHQQQQHHQSNPNDDDMKILNSNSIDKCISYVHQVESTPLKDIAVDEVEFSDTEDMLEGIRNVVDKVSIEDTCDDIDLMVTPTSLRGPWFASDSFSGIGSALSQMQTEPLKIEHPHALLMFSNAVPVEKKEEKPEIETRDIHETSAPPFYPKEEEEEDERNHCNDNTMTTMSFKHESDGETKVTRVTRQKSKFSKILTEGDVVVASGSDEVDENDEEYSPADDDDDSLTTAQSMKKLFICAKCSREFNSSNALKYHNRTHSGLRPHQCEVCGRSFFAHGALKSHMRTHTGDKPFECLHCLRKFRQWGDLKYHTISIHSEEKSHQCEFCGKAFSRKYSLVLHRRIHTSERNYTCEYCSKTFRASSYLQNHRKIHTGEKPHECVVCSKKFRVSGDLRRHMQIHQRTALRNVVKTEEVDYIEEAISVEEKKSN